MTNTATPSGRFFMPFPPWEEWCTPVPHTTSDVLKQSVSIAAASSVPFLDRDVSPAHRSQTASSALESGEAATSSELAKRSIDSTGS